MNKKAATSLSILLLVILTLVLVGFALFTFLTQKIKTNNFLYQGLEDMYAKEAVIKFYVSEGMPLSSIDLIEGASFDGNKVTIKEKIDEGEGAMEISYEFDVSKEKILEKIEGISQECSNLIKNNLDLANQWANMGMSLEEICNNLKATEQ